MLTDTPKPTASTVTLQKYTYVQESQIQLPWANGGIYTLYNTDFSHILIFANDICSRTILACTDNNQPLHLQSTLNLNILPVWENTTVNLLALHKTFRLPVTESVGFQKSISHNWHVRQTAGANHIVNCTLVSNNPTTRKFYSTHTFTT